MPQRGAARTQLRSGTSCTYIGSTADSSSMMSSALSSFSVSIYAASYISEIVICSPSFSHPVKTATVMTGTAAIDSTHPASTRAS